MTEQGFAHSIPALRDESLLQISSDCRTHVDVRSSNSKSRYRRLVSHISGHSHHLFPSGCSGAALLLSPGAARLRSTTSEGTFTKRQFVGVPPTSRIRVSDVGANSPTNARILRFRKRSVARKRRCWRRRFIGLSTTYHDRVPTKTPSRRAASCVAGSDLRRCSSRQKIEPTNSALRSPAASGHWTNSRCTTGRTSRPVRESPEVRAKLST